MSGGELLVTYTWSRALLQLTIYPTNLTNPYLTFLTHLMVLQFSWESGNGQTDGQTDGCNQVCYLDAMRR